MANKPERVQCSWHVKNIEQASKPWRVAAVIEPVLKGMSTGWKMFEALCYLTQLSSHNSSHTTHITQLISHNSTYTTTHLTQLISHTTHVTQLLSHNSSHTTQLSQLITQNSFHRTHLTQLISHNSSHTQSSHPTHLAQLMSHNNSSHTSQLTQQFISPTQPTKLLSHNSSLTQLISHNLPDPTHLTHIIFHLQLIQPAWRKSPHSFGLTFLLA